MYPLFETIRYCNGLAENLSYHQHRVNQSLLILGKKQNISLQNILDNQISKPINDNVVYKFRIEYNFAGKYYTTFEKYNIKKINTVKLVDIGNNTYPLKFKDRKWIDDLLFKNGTDEIIMTQNGIVKDASYANLVFFNGEKWFTPKSPLLFGTRRSQLLALGFISESTIYTHNLHEFKQLKFINAMMLWENSPTINLQTILL